MVDFEDLIPVATSITEPVTLYDLKLQCGLSPVEDQDHVKSKMLSDLLRRYLATARSKIESITRRVFTTQTWTGKLDGFPHPGMRYDDPWLHCAIRIPNPPFQSIVSFSYIDITGTSQVLVQDTTYGNGIQGQYSYQLDPGGATQPARIAPAWPLCHWPLTRNVLAAVQITFETGYSPSAIPLPPEIQQAILFQAHSYYEPSFYKDIDALVYDLVNPYRNFTS